MPDNTSLESHRKIRDKRGRNAAIAGIFSQSMNILSGFATVPIMLPYLGQEIFGIWLVLTGFVAFLSFSDLGVAVGMQNCLTKCDAENDKQTPSAILTTSLLFSVTAACLLTLISFELLPLISFSDILKLESNEAKEIVFLTARAVILAFSVTLPLILIQRVFDAYQEGFISNILLGIGRILSFMSVAIAVWFEFSLPWIAFFYMVSPYILVGLAGVRYIYKRPWLRPRLSHFNLFYLRKMVSTGLLAVFSHLGISTITTGSLLVLSNIYGVLAIAAFALTQRLLSAVVTLQTVLLQPLWPAYGEAYQRNDINWLRETFLKSFVITAVISFVGLLFFYFAGSSIIFLWTGEKGVTPESPLLFACVFWAFFRLLNRTMLVLLSGVNRLSWQAVYSFLLPVLSIFLVYLTPQNLNSFLTSLWIIILVGEVGRFIFLSAETLYFLKKIAPKIPAK